MRRPLAILLHPELFQREEVHCLEGIAVSSLLLKKISLFPVPWPLSFHCHYINSFVTLAIFFVRNELFKFSNLIILRLSSYINLIKEIKMCCLFVSILNHHLLKNVAIISHWKIWKTNQVYKEVSLFLKSVWNPHEKKKSARIFSWKRFHFIARAGNIK